MTDNERKKEMKKYLVLLVSALFITAMAGCKDDEPETATQEEVIASECEMIAECSPDIYALVGGTPEACATAAGGQIFADCTDFDDELAAECIDAAEAMECTDFDTALTGMMGGDPSGFPEACTTMCGE
jgi:3-hydroxyisobutyrate dehydrogenase-like beta-hydroxyacid dehydrogenase